MTEPSSQDTIPKHGPTLELATSAANACSAIPLTIRTSGAETIRISGLPPDAELSAGQWGEGAWQLKPDELLGLKLKPPAGFTGQIELVVTAWGPGAGKPVSISKTLTLTVMGLEDMDNRREAFTPATTAQSIGLTALLIVATIILVVAWLGAFRQYQGVLSEEIRVSWKQPDGYTLRPGPKTFRYDPDTEQLIHAGPIDDARKKILAALLTRLEGEGERAAADHSGTAVGSPPEPAVSREQGAYWAAIDQLAYDSNRKSAPVFGWLLVLAGLSGVLGVQIRSIISFVGISCFKNTLDVRRWWPWYLLRPLQGFMLGLLAVLVIQAGLFVPEGGIVPETHWWLAISMLVGFGAEDFTQRLRLVSQALFGKST